MSLPPPRPELSAQLLEAIHRRDPAATARLLRQWVHRRGLSSLEAFCRGTVLDRLGPEACAWLRGQLEGAAPPMAAGPQTSPMAPAPQPPPMAPVAEAAPWVPAHPAPAASALPAIPPAAAISPSRHPAPAPPSLADLRAWLSAAPQQRRAS